MLTSDRSLKIILLTGPSGSGKSFLSEELEAEGCRILHNDKEIMRPIFDLLPKESERRLHLHIGNAKEWEHIREYVNFDRLVIIHHRDWFLRNGCPSLFVAEGWMYSRQDHRKLVEESFSRIAERTVDITIAKYLPSDEVFVQRYRDVQNDHVQRYCKLRVDNPNLRHDPSVAYWQGIVARGEEIKHATAYYADYKNNQWEEPPSGTRCVVVRDIDDVRQMLRG